MTYFRLILDGQAIMYCTDKKEEAPVIHHLSNGKLQVSCSTIVVAIVNSCITQRMPYKRWKAYGGHEEDWKGLPS